MSTVSNQSDSNKSDPNSGEVYAMAKYSRDASGSYIVNNLTVYNAPKNPTNLNQILEDEGGHLAFSDTPNNLPPVPQSQSPLPPPAVVKKNGGKRSKRTGTTIKKHRKRLQRQTKIVMLR